MSDCLKSQKKREKKGKKKGGEGVGDEVYKQIICRTQSLKAATG